MLRSTLSLALMSIICSTANAGLVLDFNAGTDGFFNNAGVSVTQNSFNGGSLRIETNGGDDTTAAQLDFTAGSAIGMKLALAQLNGGTISFDVFVIANEQVGSGFFQSGAVLQSNSNGNGLDTFSRENDFLSVPAAGQVSSQTFTFNIVNAPNGSPEASNTDDNFHYQATPSGGRIFLGINNAPINPLAGLGEDAGYSSSSIYIDNFTITAVPEPGSMILFSTAVFGVLLRRKRR